MRLLSSFKVSLTLHFVAVAALPILLLGLVGLEYFKNKHLETIARLLDAHAVDVSREATEFLKDTTGSLTIVQQTLNSGLLQSDEDINQYLQLTAVASESFESIFLLNDDFTVTHLGLSEFSGSRDDYVGIDFSAHDIFSYSRNLTDKTWSDTFLSTVTVEPSVTLGIPLKNGLLLGTVSLKKLSAELSSRLEKAGENFNFSLLDHHGVIIADTRQGVISQRINLRQHPEVRAALDKGTEAPLNIHEGNSLLESVRLVPETKWVAYASLPIDIALQGVSTLRYLLVASLSLAGGLGVVLSIWLSRRMLRPILLLCDSAFEASQGRYDQDMPAVDYEELEHLSSSFQKMLSAVRDREQSLRDSQSRYIDLVNSIDGIVWELDVAEFRFTIVSEQAEYILGYPAQRWIDEKDFWQDHVHADDRDWVVSFCVAETKARRDHDFEYRMVAADGRVVWLKDVVSVVVEDGKPVRLSGVMLDITERKNAELVLQETTDRLELLIQRMPIGCVLWDADGKAQLWNPAAENIFGYEQAEVLGRPPSEFLFGDSVKGDANLLYEQLAEGTSSVHRVDKVSTKDGRMIVCDWHHTPLVMTSGVHQGMISMVEDVTLRVLAEDSLKESENRFRTIFQTNPDAVLISSLVDGRILNVNENLLEMTGFAREEVMGKTSIELGLWYDPADRETYLNMAMQDTKIENFTAPMRIKNGRIRTALISARAMMLNDEHCLLTVVRDITAIKQAEERMARSEARFRSLIEVMGEGLLILGFNGEIIQCNQAAERILKMSAEQLVGKLHDELTHEMFFEDGSLCPKEEYPSFYTLNTGRSVENRIMGLPGGDGGMLWVQINTNALGLDKDGKPNAVVVSFADVTKLKEIEKNLRSNEKNLQVITNQFRGVLEAIPDQIIVLDGDMRIVWLNRQVEAGPAGQVGATGVPCHELSEIMCGPASGNLEPLCNNCPIKRAFISGKTEQAQMELANGRTLSLRAFPIFGEADEIVNVIEIVQDVTDALRQQNQAMRAGQLAALGELAAGVAHEINNPINGVINYAQLILNKTVADSREQELSQRIIRESERVATIVRELLYFAREETHEIHKVTIAEALDEALALLLNQLNKQAVILEVDLADGLPLVSSRSHQVQQLFLNLISNARYALSERYPDPDDNKILRISADVVENSDRPFVRIVFRDHGVGIPPEILPKVMNPFTTTKPAGEGTGLGLSISHEIVQKHGGTINIDSVLGDFTEVVVELPAETA